MLQPLFDQLENALISQPVLANFKFRKGYRDFIQHQKDQVWGVHLSYIKYHEYFEVTCDVGIRFEHVEDILNRERPHLSEKEKSNTFTIGAELGNLLIGEPKYWTIRTESDTRVVGEDIALWVQDVGIPFFSTYSDFQAALANLKNEKGPSLLAPINRQQVISAMETVVHA